MLELKILIFFVVWKCVSLHNSNPIVQIGDGKLQGAGATIGERRYVFFKGIPYANPPTGINRFEDPQPRTPWSGIWNATIYQSPCLQLADSSGKTLGDEDCLFLNVFTPTLDEKASLPVVVFIHGGDFLGGSGGLYDPCRLMKYDIVFVTINYRLGPLGFLSTGDDVVPGNAGLKDQAFALRWIQRNIKHFGGNPKSVTLTGHSSGAACVYHHYLSPWSRDTFQRGIAFSGSALAAWALDYSPVQKGRNLANVAGCSYTTSQAMVQCLKSKSGADIVKAQEIVDKDFNIYSLFQPVVESPKVKNPFLAEYPYQAIINRKMQKVPLMMTATSDEGLIPAAIFQAYPELMPAFNERWPALASLFLSYNKTLPGSRSNEVAKKIKDFYFDGKSISLETFWPLVRMETDRVFHASIGKLAVLHAKYAAVPVHVYEYSYPGSYSFSNLLTNDSVVYGAAHTDDILHILKMDGFDSGSQGDQQMNKVLGDIVYSFASTGVPTVSEKVRWEPISAGCDEVRYMEISTPTKFEMRSSRNFGNESFWDSLGFNENENYHSH